MPLDEFSDDWGARGVLVSPDSISLANHNNQFSAEPFELSFEKTAKNAGYRLMLSACETLATRSVRWRNGRFEASYDACVEQILRAVD